MSYHERTIVIAPVFQKYWNCRLIRTALDTDLLGTFIGEVPRVHDQLTTCRMKAYQAALLAMQSCAEGCFGPHPLIPWVPMNHEVMVLIDKERDIFIQEELLPMKPIIQRFKLI